MTNRSKVNRAVSFLAAAGLGMTAGGEGGADDEGAVLGAQAHRILEPSVEVGAGDLKLQLAEGRVPYTVGSGVLHEFPSDGRVETGRLKGADGGNLATVRQGGQGGYDKRAGEMAPLSSLSKAGAKRPSR